MAAPYTQAMMRDEVRRLLEIVPPIDTGTGAIGDEPAAQADPQNIVINSALNQGIAAINRIVRVGLITQLSVTVPAASANRLGKQYIDVASVVTTALSPNEIEDVIFKDTVGGTTLRLVPYDYYKSTKSFDPYQQFPPGKPQLFIVAGTQIALIPPSINGGTLYFDAAGSIPLFTTDSDSTSLLPDDFQWAIIYWAVSILSGRKATDTVAAARAATFGAQARETTLQIYTWKNGFGEAGIKSVRSTLQMMSMAEIVQAVQQQQAAQSQQGQGQ